jgi:hypothetical protein
LEAALALRNLLQKSIAPEAFLGKDQTLAHHLQAPSPIQAATFIAAEDTLYHQIVLVILLNLTALAQSNGKQDILQREQLLLIYPLIQVQMFLQQAILFWESLTVALGL